VEKIGTQLERGLEEIRHIKTDLHGEHGLQSKCPGLIARVSKQEHVQRTMLLGLRALWVIATILFAAAAGAWFKNCY